ncbi:MAG: hypothetical protein QOD32_1807 [Pyrinomonadaceae bacterium]|jgi:ElaB/YqjD/DUF883 family membrane-anchored ribosome-binding protein|nr:hypothetical protein [Pyrinomonadaceae bacterium]
MSQNTGNNDPQNKGGNTGTTAGAGGSGLSAGSGRTDEGTTRNTATTGGGTGGGSSAGGGALSTTGGAGGGTGTAPAKEGLAGTAQEYGQKITEAATTAKDYVSDKISVAGDKLKDLQNVDYKQVAEDAKNYAREKPGQALLISAAAGFLIGLLLKSSNRR